MSIKIWKLPCEATKQSYHLNYNSDDIYRFCYYLRANTHPFRGKDLNGREWILAHNGTIFEGDVLNEYFHVQEGETDSERILLYLLDTVNHRIRQESKPLDSTARFELLQDIIFLLSPQNKLNLLIYDGEFLYVHTNCVDTLYYKEDNSGIYFSTTPLRKGAWVPVPMTRLISYKDGFLYRTGKSHGNEYIPDQESINALYLMYSNL